MNETSIIIRYSIYNLLFFPFSAEVLPLLCMLSVQALIQQLQQGDEKTLARCISMVENENEGYEELLSHLHFAKTVPVIGITGPPGAGKSTLINALVKQFIFNNKRIGIIAVDPTSPFNHGSLLGDRLRMSQHFNNPNVFIRSLATRGSLGGLSEKIMEIVDVMRTAPFDFIFIETVGVGQSEIEITGLADTTLLVLVPESGDEIQTMKSGIMEIADIFVVNKSDREGADIFAKNLQQLVFSKSNNNWQIPVVKATATKGIGVTEIIEKIEQHQTTAANTKKIYMLTEKAYRLIQRQRMKDIDKTALLKEVNNSMNKHDFNVYALVKKYM